MEGPAGSSRWRRMGAIAAPPETRLSSPRLESFRGLWGAQSVEVLFSPCCFCSAPSLHQRRLLPSSLAAVLCSSISQVAK